MELDTGTPRAEGALVIPEGVVLGFETAGLASRVLARALDLVVCGLALYVLLIALAVMTPPLWVMIAAITVAVFSAIFVYPAVMETLTAGRTVGKIAMGLRVVTDLGSPVRFRHATIRAALSVVDLLITTGFAGMVAIGMTARRQRLGDVAAGTVVVRTRTRLGSSPTRLLPPSGYDSFTESLNTRPLAPGDIALARDVLDRSARGPRLLDRQVAQLSSHLDHRLGGQRPGQMPHDTFLRCVVAADAQTVRPTEPLRKVPSGQGGIQGPAALD